MHESVAKRFRRDGFYEVGIESRVATLLPIIGLPVPGYGYESDGPAQFGSKSSADFITVQAWEADVDERDIWPGGARQLDATSTLLGDADSMPVDFQHHPEHLASIGIVLDHEDVQSGHHHGGLDRRANAHLSGSAQWQPNNELASPSWPVTLDCDSPSVQLHQITNDRQADAQAPFGARQGSVGLSEQIEYVWKHLGQESRRHHRGREAPPRHSHGSR